MLELTATADFQATCREVLRYLHARFGFKLWMVTRTEEPHWIVLHSHDTGYGVKDGDVFEWADSFCSRMVIGLGPRIAPRASEVPAYATAPIGRQVPIAAYIGIPLLLPDESIFGTLCAIDPAPKSDDLLAELPLLELLTRMLEKIVATELRANDEARRADRAEAEATTDHLTGLYNRRGWDALLAAEEERCRRLGDPAAIISIDLDGLKEANDSLGHHHGDYLLRTAGRVLQLNTRAPNVVARVGGDEFLVLAVGCKRTAANALMHRLENALAEADIAASLGCCCRDPRSTLAAAVQAADAQMYQAKHARKAVRAELVV